MKVLHIDKHTRKIFSETIKLFKVTLKKIMRW